MTSNTYYDWLLENDYIILAAMGLVTQFLATFEEFPGLFVNQDGPWSFWKGPNPYGVRSRREEGCEAEGAHRARSGDARAEAQKERARARAKGELNG